jgi:hypothetical protein
MSQTITVKGKIQNGRVLALEPIDESLEGEEVQITLLTESKKVNGNGSDKGLSDIMKFVSENSVDTGIHDMAHQHDHYLYGSPKQDD